jgi:hypothetical protein
LLIDEPVLPTPMKARRASRRKLRSESGASVAMMTMIEPPD